MKIYKITKNLILLFSLLVYTSNNLISQELGEIDGTLKIQMNSTSGTPHISLVEDDTSPGGSTRLEFRNADNTTDEFEIRSFLNPSVDPIIGWYYNNSLRVVWNEDDQGLGIGTSSPVEKLHVVAPGNNGIRIDGNDTGDSRLSIENGGGFHFLFDDDSDSHALDLQSANDFNIMTGGTTERLTILSTGEVTVNDGNTLGRQFGVLSDNLLYAIEGENDNTTTSVGTGGKVLSTGTGNKFAIYGLVSGSSNSSGSVFGVYGTCTTVPASHWASYANGDFWYSGTLEAPSDIRLKTNIRTLENVLDKVVQIETKRYEFDHNKYQSINLAHGEQIGFIAQNVQSLFPDLVSSQVHSYGLNETENEEIEILGLNSIGMIPILTKAIQEQQAIIEELKNKNQELNASIEALTKTQNEILAQLKD